MANITDMSTNPDFNYKSLNRRDLMSLSTINNEDIRSKRFKQVDTNRDWSTNLFNLDIEGSVPKKFGVMNQKVDFINKVDDIERANPKVLHFPLNKQEFNLSCKDIAWASPQTNRNFITTRIINPLEPKYNLPKVEEIPPPVPKFIRDNINVEGIEGAHPRKYFQWETRKMFDNSEIKGSSAKKPYVRNTQYSNIDYSDVTHDEFKTKRSVNPLDPVYEVKYKGGENYVHGQIEGSKPVTYAPYIYSDPFNLKINDIDGTQVGSKNRINKFSGKDYNMATTDVLGARSGSLKKGIVTVRQTDPLNPNYVLPGQMELNKFNNPYGNTLFSKSAKVRQNNGTEINKKNLENQNSHQSQLSHNANHEENYSNTKNPQSSHSNQNNPQQKKNNPFEVVGFNNQIFNEDEVEFDAEKFKKPQPFYGFVHDKYIISTDNMNKKDIDAKKTLLTKNGTINNQTMNNSSNSNNKTTKAEKTGFNSEKSTNMSDNPKQSYAQLLDKFIQKNPGLD